MYLKKVFKIILAYLATWGIFSYLKMDMADGAIIHSEILTVFVFALYIYIYIYIQKGLKTIKELG